MKTTAIDRCPDLSSFWDADVARRVAALDAAEIAREHDAICARFAEAMADGLDLPESAWRHLGALQRERGRRVDLLADRPSTTGPVAICWERCSDADPVRLSFTVLCF